MLITKKPAPPTFPMSLSETFKIDIYEIWISQILIMADFDLGPQKIVSPKSKNRFFWMSHSHITSLMPILAMIYIS